jgi:hypothetical protein
LQEDPDNEFFKNGSAKSKSKSRKKSDDKEQDQRPTYTAYKYSKNGRVSLHESVILTGRPVFLSCDNGNA